ncbi:RNA-binding S4 domain-containing protein [Albimonas sp. CAU 1670]|uniref:RNA-binding S4 domain-containing protein n=1 Tax=Albimonas sp. CAU 1670 TaxID=3032599 RepID=UPI0023DCDAEF|nr:RNA-binding S4 domain-containing protein [Albimonas sp. CAU 1670]MDF2231656.1 RNA-binding S4 domain-containing protein [Albimonas sp. CAU 1670]
MTAAAAEVSDADGGGAPSPSGAGSAGLRLDKWLWHARFVKSRSLAAKLVSESGVRVNGTRASKPAAAVRPGDVLTFVLGRHVRVIRILDLGTRRGPAPEAQALYDDLDPPAARAAEPDPDVPAPAAERERGAGRPTKAERRALDRLRDGEG